MTNPYRIGWFSTGRDKAARDLLTAVNSSIERGEIKAEIAFVFCSREPGEAEKSDLFIKLVESYRIPLVYCSYQQFKNSRNTTTSTQTATLPQWRLDYDREIMKRLASFNPDLCVLAGYMLIVGKNLCRKYDMINLHPAAPGGPVGTWQEVIRQLIADDARQTGVMMHLVTPELDKGPAVTCCTFSIRGEPFDRYWPEIAGMKTDSTAKRRAKDSLFKLIRKHGLAREFPLIIATLQAFSQGNIRVTADKKVTNAAGKQLKGYNLTDEINEQLKEINLP